MPTDFSLLGVTLWLLGTLLCFLLPVLPAFKELKFPDDALPLNIQSDHTGTVDFRAWELMAAVPDLEQLGDRTELVPLEGESEWRRLLRARPSLEVRTHKPLSVAAPVITSLVSVSDVCIEQGVRIQKLLQGRNVHCQTGAKMGLFTSASEELCFESAVNFTKVAAVRIITLPRGVSRDALQVQDLVVPKITRLHVRHGGDLTLSAGQCVTESLIIRGHLTTAEDAVIDGNVKVYGNVKLGRGTRVTGSLFVQGDVICQPNVLVGGPLSATGVLRLGAGAQVGTPSYPSSVMAHRVQLGMRVQVFGSISSVARGTVLQGA